MFAPLDFEDSFAAMLRRLRSTTLPHLLTYSDPSMNHLIDAWKFNHTTLQRETSSGSAPSRVGPQASINDCYGARYAYDRIWPDGTPVVPFERPLIAEVMDA